MLVVLGTDCTGSCKSNYQTIMIMTLPQIKQYEKAHLSNIWNFSILFKVYSYVHLFMKSYLFTSICVTKNSILKIRRTHMFSSNSSLTWPEFWDSFSWRTHISALSLCISSSLSASSDFKTVSLWLFIRSFSCDSVWRRSICKIQTNHKRLIIVINKLLHFNV